MHSGAGRSNGTARATTPCAGVLFVYFKNADCSPPAVPCNQHFALSRDGRKFTTLNGGRAIAALNPARGASVRDPFVRRSPLDGLWHLVATNGDGFGGTDTILHWSSRDLVHWSGMRVLEVMKKYKAQVANTWAPEWVWDAAAQVGPSAFCFAEPPLHHAAQMLPLHPRVKKGGGTPLALTQTCGARCPVGSANLWAQR